MPVDGAAAGGSLKLVGDFTYHSQVDFLGKGSFADVFRARHKELKGVVVAIKRVKKRQLTPRVRASLEQEIAILKLLKHPHIVQLYTTYDSTNHKYLVMEFCPDGDLAQYLKKQPNNRLPAPEIQRYLQQIADALEYLRERNIVHRDLKPQNLLLSSPLASSAAELVLARTQSSKAAARAGAGPSAAAAAAAASSSTTTTSADPFAATDSASLRLIKIADFGFARDLIGLDMADTVCGSPYYMAPEILESKPYDASADLWSLGVILFECFTGRRPFKANSYIELGNMIKRHGDSLAMPAEAPQHAQHLMKGLLRKDAKDRISFDAFFAHKFVDFESYKSRAGASPPVTPPREKTPPGTSATTTTTAATKTPERRVSPKISRPDVVAARRQPDDDDDDAGDDDVVEALATAMKEDTALVNVSQFDTLDEFAPLPTIKPFKDMSGSAFTAAATPPGTTTTAAAAATTTTIASTLPSTAIVAPSTLTQSGNAFASGSASGSVSGFVVIDRPAVVNAFADAVGNTRSPPVQSSSEKRGAGIALAAQVSSGPVDMCAASPNRGIISPVTPQNSPATYATSPSDLSSGQLVSSYQRQHQERIALQQQPQQQEYQRGAYGQVVRVLSSMATRLFGTSLHGDSSAATATGPAVSLASLIQQEQQESYFCRELNTCANRGRAVMHFAMERQLVAHGGDPAATSNTASAATTSIGGTGSTACSLSPSESFMTSPRLRMVCNAEALLLYTRALHVLYRGILYAQRCIQQPSADTSRPRSSSSVASSVSSSQSSTSYSSSPNPLMSSAGISVDTMPINVSPRVNDVVQVLRTLFNDCLDKADAIRSENAQLAKRLSLSVNGDIEVPSAEKMIYEHSLGLCRDGAVEELVGDLTEASTHYQRAKLMLEAIVMPTADGEQPPSLSREGIVAVQNALQGIGKRLWVLSLRTQGRRPSSATVSGATP